MISDQTWNPEYLDCERQLRDFDRLYGDASFSQEPSTAQQKPPKSDEREGYSLEASTEATFTENLSMSLQELFPEGFGPAYLPPAEREGVATRASTGDGGGSLGAGVVTMHASTSANPPLVGVVGEQAGFVGERTGDFQAGDVTSYVAPRNDQHEFDFGEPLSAKAGSQAVEQPRFPYDPNFALAVPQDSQGTTYAGPVPAWPSSRSNVDGIANERPKPRDDVSSKSRQEANKGRRSDKESPGMPCKWSGCTSTFTKKYNLDEHMKLHYNLGEFVCCVSSCEKRSNTRHLQRSHHIRKHHIAREYA
ncbi:uncharacterized protein SCHCODRAFT_02598452 [Schizophyllum commune H4-8]|uniref:Expressed protein n=1 Tax=Schizophyllum commune (strain H4-8 / FGSC 9210) TaxID=578458 RepID=D8Q1D6_SCHCM|nr:uncharacterized protein SCHCODRAFT_02598452 [Schizophyllum commune H4-8]KAI5895375.1 hypothetical protein SCHCODRAFT_02598452 [Schizophyllum commune H4-8]